MLTIQDIVILAIGILLLVLWLVLFFFSKKYDQIFSTLDEKEFPLCQLYSIGYAFWEIVGKKYKSKNDRKLRNRIEILYGKKYTEFYLRVIYAQKMTISMLLVVVAFGFYGLSQDVVSMGVILMFAGLAYYYFGTLVDKKIEKRSEEMMGDFADALSNLALLTNAGMMLREAWATVAENGEKVLYQEMLISLDEMNNGVSEMEAMRRFGNRCVVPEIRKFSSTIMQGIEKGNGDISIMLQEQSKEVWGARKQNVRRQGEKASGKLLAPMAIMFVGILIMVIVPIFANLGM